MEMWKCHLLRDLACAVPHPGNGWGKRETLKSPGVSPETSSKGKTEDFFWDG